MQITETKVPQDVHLYRKKRGLGSRSLLSEGKKEEKQRSCEGGDGDG